MIAQNLQPTLNFVYNLHLLCEAYRLALRVDSLYTDSYAY